MIDYENLNNEILYNFITQYIEDIVPVPKDEGFMYCEYEKVGPINNLLISFYFKLNTGEDMFDLFFDFAEEEGLKYKDQKLLIKNTLEIRFNLEITDEYYEKYEIEQTRIKYNL
jgi:hypothetical protein